MLKLQTAYHVSLLMKYWAGLYCSIKLESESRNGAKDPGDYVKRVDFISRQRNEILIQNDSPCYWEGKVSFLAWVMPCCR